ncbi:MAG: hypothetical protein RL530_428, partial [Actinomycetota bacterium]
ESMVTERVAAARIVNLEGFIWFLSAWLYFALEV